MRLAFAWVCHSVEGQKGELRGIFGCERNSFQFLMLILVVKRYDTWSHLRQTGWHCARLDSFEIELRTSLSRLVFTTTSIFYLSHEGIFESVVGLVHMASMRENTEIMPKTCKVSCAYQSSLSLVGQNLNSQPNNVCITRKSTRRHFTTFQDFRSLKLFTPVASSPFDCFLNEFSPKIIFFFSRLLYF